MEYQVTLNVTLFERFLALLERGRIGKESKDIKGNEMTGKRRTTSDMRWCMTHIGARGNQDKGQ
jgi:hypothetical protein